MRQRLKGLLPLLTTLILLISTGVAGQERILDYHSEIRIAPDASLSVTENIRVRAEGDAIRRGVYRDFPTRYTDRAGNDYVVDFQVIQVTRDGQPEPWRTERSGNGVRLYVGDADTVLAPGEYDYAINYVTDRQVGYFENHDELYWNITGFGWAFTIEQASARVQLPSEVPAEELTIEGYTGSPGDSGQAYTTTLSDGTATIETTTALMPGEGITLAMSWPKGVVAEPSIIERLGYILQDNLGLLLSILALAGSTLYLYLAWARVGRDPEAGVIFPHYAPPAGYSPASSRYILKMGYDNKTLTAAVVNLAVKGHLRIVQEGDDYRLERLSSEQPLAPGEKALLQKLFEKEQVLELENENHEILSAAQSAHHKALKRDYLNIYFAKNAWFLLPSIVGSIAILILIFILNAFVPLVLLVFAFIVILHIIFAFLLKAPSKRGRLLLDKLEGFRLYLEVAEKDDLNLRHPPELTPELFERYLPFAIALGVEQEWAERFNDVFARLEGRDGVSYTPLWYAGTFSALHMGAFADNVSSSVTTAISSASVAPGTSSGIGGGGFAGGGGGGGGGGGW